MPVLLVPLHEYNTCHVPHGPQGGQFCSTGGEDYTIAGLTSARPKEEAPERTGRVVLGPHLTAFEQQLKALPGVRDVTVMRARGGWNGGHEPSWAVRYRGNGAARRLMAQVGIKYNQDAVLRYTPCSGANCEPLTDWHLGRVSGKARAVIEEELTKLGFGGWTWFRTKGVATLRIVHVPKWPTDKIKTADDYEAAATALTAALTQSHPALKLERHQVTVDLMTRDTFADDAKK